MIRKIDKRLVQRVKRAYALAIVMHEDEPDGNVTPDHLADLAEILATINVSQTAPEIRPRAGKAVQRFQREYADWWSGDLWPVEG